MPESESISLKTIKSALTLFFFIGAAAVFLTFRNPSEPRNSVWLGYSAERLALGIFLILLLILFAIALVVVSRKADKTLNKLTQLNTFLAQGDRLLFAWLTIAALLLFALWCFVFSWLFILANFRPAIGWAGIILLTSLIALTRSYSSTLRNRLPEWRARYRLFPRLSDLSKDQKHVFWLLCILGILTIVVLMPSNINGTADWNAFQRYGGDEYVIYPILMDVMAPGETFSATLYHRFIYEDYHYGYPFYAWSIMVLQPVQWLLGADFPDAVHINLPLLRIMVSVVPVILAAIILVYLFTQFRGILISSAVFLFLITAPGTMQNNQGFWHPDGLNLLFVVLTIYFLRRDRFRFGRNYYLSAFFCGLSIAIRLYGFFFAPAIAVYLLIPLFKKQLSLGNSIRKGLLFILVMTLTIAFSSPYLFRSDARQNMLAILNEKSGEMAEGYAGDYDPRNDYRPGWDAWYPAFEDHYVEMLCFFFLIFSMVVGFVIGNHRLTHLITFLWFVTITGYLIFFVAVKSTQYVLPALLPLMAAIFSLPITLQDWQSAAFYKKKQLVTAAWITSIGIFLAQLIINLIKIAPRF